MSHDLTIHHTQPSKQEGGFYPPEQSGQITELNYGLNSIHFPSILYTSLASGMHNVGSNGWGTKKVWLQTFKAALELHTLLAGGYIQDLDIVKASGRHARWLEQVVDYMQHHKLTFVWIAFG